MLPPRLDAGGVRPAGAVSPPTTALPVSEARQAALQRTLGGMVGQSMQGQVLSNYQDGSSLVRVAGASMRMMLPPGTQVGAELPMTLISVSPRPTFQIGNQAAGQPVPLYSASGAAAQQLPSQETATLPGRLPGQAGAGGAGQPGLPGGANPAAGGQANGAAAAGANNANGAANAGAAANGAASGAASGAANAAANAAAGAAANAAANSAAGTAAGSAANAAAANAAGNPAAGAQAASARPPSLAATLLGKAPLTPADQLPQLDRNTPQPTLSQGARAIASALASAYLPPGTPATILGKSPLVTGGAPNPQQLSHSLRDALGISGLFYESHVAEWAEGKRPLADLQREPQMQRAASQSGPQTSETLARAALAGPDLSAAQMINQQLHAHEQQRVQWQGEAWPGQPVQWEVRREQRERNGREQSGQEQEPEQVWRSGVRFRLPLLGQVDAAVTVVGEQVHIQVQTGDNGSAETLRAWAGQLQRAMEAAGAPLASLAIHAEPGQDEPAMSDSHG